MTKLVQKEKMMLFIDKKTANIHLSSHWSTNINENWIIPNKYKYSKIY